MADRKAKQQTLFPMFLTTFLDLLGVTIVIPILAPLFLAPESGFFAGSFTSQHKTIVLGLLLAAYPLAQFFSAPMLGAISDRIGRRKVLIISLIGTAIGYLLFGIGIATKSLEILFISRILDGITGGNLSTVNSAIADVSDETNKTKNFGVIGAAFGLGFILGPFIGGVLSNPQYVSWFNYATPFWFQTGFSVINIIFVYFYFPETLKVIKKSKLDIFEGFKNIKKALAMHNIKVMFLVSFMMSFGFNLFVQFFSVYLVQRFKLNQSQIGGLFAYVGVWLAFSQGFLIRFVAKKYQPSKVITVAVFGVAFGLLALLLPHRRFDLFIILPLVAILWGITQPNITTIISNLAGKNQGEIMGIGQSLASLAQVIPPIVDGVIFAINPNMPIMVSSGVIFAAWVIFTLYYNKHLRQKFSYILKRQ